MPDVTPVDLLTAAIKASNLELCQKIAQEYPTALSERDSRDGATAAHWAALMGSLEILNWLVELGVPLDVVVASSGMQPIHWAATRGHVDVVRLLLRQGVTIDALDIKHTSPLAIAAQYDHTILVFFLVRERADINILDDCSDSALHWAAYKGNQHTAALLHYLGLPADAKDSYGSTPLHLATAQGASSVVEYLLESSEAEKLLQIKDSKGRTAASVARERGHRHVLRIISAMQPTLMQRVLGGVIGQTGEKIMFVFFWINSTLCYLTYYFMLAGTVGSSLQAAAPAPPRRMLTRRAPRAR